MPSVAHPPRSALIWRFVLVGLGLFFAGWYFWQGMLNASVADVPSQDLPHAYQTVWNVAHGHGFQYTDVTVERNVPRLSAHADYFLVLLAPLLWLWQNYGLLLLVQVIGVALGAWALWRITKHVTNREGAATLLTIAYLAYGPLQFAVTFQFHAVTLALPLLLWAVEAVLWNRRWWVVAVWFGLALTTKEQVGFIAGPLLWWVSWQNRHRRQAWTWLGAGVAYSLIQFLWLIPAARPATDPHLFWQFYYGTLGRTPQEIVPRLLQPTELWRRLATVDHAQDILALLLPLGGLALLSPIALLAIVALLPHWLADYSAVNSLYYQNHMLALAPLFVAAVFGLQRLQRAHWWPKFTWLLTAGLVFAMIIGSVIMSPNPWSFKYLSVFRQGDGRVPQMARLSRQIPATASVAVAWGLPPVFRNHQTVHTLPAGYRDVDYVVVAASALPAFRDYAPQYAADLFQYFDHSAAWQPVVRTTAIGVYRRKWSIQPAPLPPTFHDPTLHAGQPQ